MGIYLNTDTTAISYKINDNNTVHRQNNSQKFDWAKAIKEYHDERLKNVPKQAQDEYSDAKAIVAKYEKEFGQIFSPAEQRAVKSKTTISDNGIVMNHIVLDEDLMLEKMSAAERDEYLTAKETIANLERKYPELNTYNYLTKKTATAQKEQQPQQNEVQPPAGNPNNTATKVTSSVANAALGAASPKNISNTASAVFGIPVITRIGNFVKNIF